MSNFAECTLIKLVPSEPHFVALTTFDMYGFSNVKQVLKKNLLSLLLVLLKGVA